MHTIQPTRHCTYDTTVPTQILDKPDTFFNFPEKLTYKNVSFCVCEYEMISHCPFPIYLLINCKITCHISGKYSKMINPFVNTQKFNPNELRWDEQRDVAVTQNCFSVNFGF